MKRIILAIFLLNWSLAKAEEIDVYGLKFNVNIETVDKNILRIEIAGRSELIAAAALNETVISQAVNSGQLSHFNKDLVKEAILKSKNANDHEVASVLLGHLLAEETPNREMAIFLADITSENSGLAVSKRVLANVKKGGGLAPYPHLADLLIAVYERDLAYSFALSDAERDALSAQILEILKLKVEGRVAREESIADFVEISVRALGSAHAVTGYLLRVSQFVEQAVNYQNELNIEGIYDLLAGASNDEYLKKLIAPYLVRTLHHKAAKLNENERYLEAISVSADVPNEKRTITTHTLINEALRGSGTLFGLDIETRSRIEALASKDMEIRSSYLKVLENEYAHYLANGDWSASEEVIAKFKELALNNSVTDDLIKKGIMASLTSGQHNQSRAFMALLHSSPPLIDKVRYSLVGTYNDPNYMIINRSLSVGLGLLLFIVVFRHWRGGADVKANDYGSERAGSAGGLLGDLDEAIDTEKALNILGLKQGATTKEIKRAFRIAVKGVHPDLVRAQGDNEQFVKLTRAYESLLKMAQKGSGRGVV